VTATQPQLIIEAAGDFLGGQNTNPRRGQLDSQGDTVHPANDRLNRSSDILAQLEPCLHVTGPISKKPGRIRRPCLTSVATLVHRQRGHWPYQLPLDVKWRTAGGQDRHGWTPAQQHVGRTPGRTQDMLATIQHQQGHFPAQVLRRRLQRRAAGSAAHRFEHNAVDQAGVGQRSQLNQVDLRPTQVTGAEAQLQGQAGLTDTADANQGDKSLSLPEQRPEFVQLPFSANEGGQGHRKVAGDLHVLRVVDTGARSGILCLPHANNHGTRGRCLDCSVSGAVSS
jgi:hypothetical protein